MAGVALRLRLLPLRPRRLLAGLGGTLARLGLFGAMPRLGLSLLVMLARLGLLGALACLPLLRLVLLGLTLLSFALVRLPLLRLALLGLPVLGLALLGLTLLSFALVCLPLLGLALLRLSLFSLALLSLALLSLALLSLALLSLALLRLALRVPLLRLALLLSIALTGIALTLGLLPGIMVPRLLAAARALVGLTALRLRAALGRGPTRRILALGERAGRPRAVRLVKARRRPAEAVLAPLLEPLRRLRAGAALLVPAGLFGRIRALPRLRRLPFDLPRAGTIPIPPRVGHPTLLARPA